MTTEAKPKTQPKWSLVAKPLAKSRLLAAVHETAGDLGRLGFIDKRMQQNLLCLEPIPAYDSERIRALREHLKLN